MASFTFPNPFASSTPPRGAGAERMTSGTPLDPPFNPHELSCDTIVINSSSSERNINTSPAMASFALKNPYASTFKSSKTASEEAAAATSGTPLDPSFDPHDLSCDTVVIVSSSSERDGCGSKPFQNVHLIPSSSPPLSRSTWGPIVISTPPQSSSAYLPFCNASLHHPIKCADPKMLPSLPLPSSSATKAAAAQSRRQPGHDGEPLARPQPPQMKRLRQSKRTYNYATKSAVQEVSEAAAVVASSAAAANTEADRKLFCDRTPCVCQPICFPQTPVAAALSSALSAVPSCSDGGFINSCVGFSYPATSTSLKQWASSFPLLWNTCIHSSHSNATESDINSLATASTCNCFDLVMQLQRASHISSTNTLIFTSTFCRLRESSWALVPLRCSKPPYTNTAASHHLQR
jgi:hypothetical protein